MTQLQTVSEWLAQYGSHEIYSYEGVREDFKTSTGLDLPAYIVPNTIKQTRQAMLERGLGGELKFVPNTRGLGGKLKFTVGDSDRVVWGYRMAEQFARNLAQFTSDKMGRGRIFDECVAAIREKGL